MTRRSDLGKDELGLTMVELLIGFLIVSILISGALLSFRDSTSRASDNEVISSAEEKAREILDMIAFDLRTVGSGMPLGQSDFAPGGTGLGPAPLPVLLESTSASIVFRINPNGRDTFVTGDFTPAITSLAVAVHDASFLSNGDTIYINDATVGGTQGLQGTVSNISGNTVTIDSSYIASPAAVFEEGSILTRSETISYESNSTDKSIRRIDDAGEVVIGEDAEFIAFYVDTHGAVLGLPLTDAMVADELSGIRVVVSVDGERPLSSGSEYVAVAQQVVTLRNLHVARTNSTGSGGSSSSSSGPSSSSSSSSSTTSTSSSNSGKGKGN
jgi:type II secretory pathway pseudopilin PulG